MNPPAKSRVASGPVLVSRFGDAGCSERRVKAPKCSVHRSQKRRGAVKTVGRWPWKSERAQECVTTHRPNRVALKMDGAETGRLYSTIRFKHQKQKRMSRQTWWFLLPPDPGG